MQRLLDAREQNEGIKKDSACHNRKKIVSEEFLWRRWRQVGQRHGWLPCWAVSDRVAFVQKHVRHTHTSHMGVCDLCH